MQRYEILAMMRFNGIIMALLGQLKRRFGKSRSYDDDVDLKGNEILLQMARDRGQVQAAADKGLEEKAKRSLQDFYTPETIDTQSIKPLSAPKIEAEREVTAGEERQLQLDLGARYAGSKASVEQIDLDTEEGQRRLLDAYVVPWVLRRQGLASRDEIEERLERIGVNGLSDLTLSFIEEERSFFAADRHIQQRARTVIDKALTYFYREDTRYPLTRLISWIEREFAMQWENYPPAFIEKCLWLSPRFTPFRHQSGELYLRLAAYPAS